MSWIFQIGQSILVLLSVLLVLILDAVLSETQTPYFQPLGSETEPILKVSVPTWFMAAFTCITTRFVFLEVGKMYCTAPGIGCSGQ